MACFPRPFPPGVFSLPLSPKLQGHFFCFNLCAEPTSSMAQFFYLGDLLNCLSLGSEDFLSQNSSTEFFKVLEELSQDRTKVYSDSTSLTPSTIFSPEKHKPYGRGHCFYPAASMAFKAVLGI